MTLHRSHFQGQRLGDLFERHLFSKAQHEDGTLLGRKPVHGRPDSFKFLARSELPLGRRSRVRQVVRNRSGSAGGLPVRFSEQEPPEGIPTASRVVRGEVHGNANQPRRHARFSAKARAVPVGAQKALLRERVGGVRVAQQPEQHPVDALLVSRNDLLKLFPGDTGDRLGMGGKGLRPCQCRFQGAVLSLFTRDDFPPARFTSPAKILDATIPIPPAVCILYPYC